MSDALQTQQAAAAQANAAAIAAQQAQDAAAAQAAAAVAQAQSANTVAAQQAAAAAAAAAQQAATAAAHQAVHAATPVVPGAGGPPQPLPSPAVPLRRLSAEDKHGVPDTIKGSGERYHVDVGAGSTKIAEYGAFLGCAGLASVALPSGLTEIGAGAFQFCSELTQITIPEGVTKIGHYAFDGCTGLRSVSLPQSLVEVGHSAFCGCTSLHGHVMYAPCVTGQAFDKQQLLNISIPPGTAGACARSPPPTVPAPKSPSQFLNSSNIGACLPRFPPYIDCPGT